MKKVLLFILLVFIYCAGNSQNTTTQNLGAPRTLVINKGGFQSDSSLILPFFSDTTSANLSQYVKTYRGNMIKVGDSVYIRNKSATKWVLMANQATTPNLQTVTNVGSTTNKSITIGDTLKLKSTSTPYTNNLITNNPSFEPEGNANFYFPAQGGTLVTTSQAIDSLKRSSDSIYARNGTQWKFQYKDGSTGYVKYTDTSSLVATHHYVDSVNVHTYVPYTGATSDVELGENDIKFQSNDSIYSSYLNNQKLYARIDYSPSEYYYVDLNGELIEFFDYENNFAGLTSKELNLCGLSGFNVTGTYPTQNGYLYIGKNLKKSTINANNITDNRTLEVPDMSGTIALTSQYIDSLKRSRDSIYAYKNGSWRFQYRDSVGTGGSGTVTSVATGYGLSGGTITTSGTLIADTSISGLSGKYVRISDTSNMLSKYLRKADTTSLSNRINLKLNISDTSSMLSTYLRKVDTTNKWVNNITRTLGKDSIIYYIGNTRYAIKDSVGTNPPASGYYGAFQDNNTQTATENNVGYPMKLRTNDLTNGITITGSDTSRITFANTGIYNLQFSSQFQNTDNAQHDITIWLRLNGTDVAGSAGYISIPARKSAGAGNEGHGVYGWNYVLSVVAGQYYQIVWSTTNAANVTMQFYTAGNPPPSTASVIATVTQQAGILAGTGITAINSLTGSAQTMVTGTDSTDFKIVSTGTSHTFNLPTASATNRGALSSANWTTFNSKIAPGDTATMLNPYLRKVDTTSLSNRINLKLNASDTASLSNRINTKFDATSYEWIVTTGLQALGSTIKGVNLGVPAFYSLGSAAILTNTAVRFVPYYLPQAATLTGVKFYQGNTASYTGNNYNGVGLYSYSGGNLTLVASTTNAASFWINTINTWVTKPFSSTYSASAGVYYIGMMYCYSAQTTAPQTLAGSTVNNAFATFDFTNSAKIAGVSNTGLTSLPSTIAMSSVNSTTNLPLIYLY